MNQYTDYIYECQPYSGSCMLFIFLFFYDEKKREEQMPKQLSGNNVPNL